VQPTGGQPASAGEALAAIATAPHLWNGSENNALYVKRGANIGIGHNLHVCLDRVRGSPITQAQLCAWKEQ
jgi:hypothetical protein